MKRYIPAFITMLLFILAASPVCAEPTEKQAAIAKSLQYLTSTQIVSREEGQELANALESISTSDDMKALSGIALEVTDKLVSDKGNLQFILTDIEKLASEKYSSALGNINPEAIATAKAKLAQLADDMEARRPSFKNSPKPLTIDDYRYMLKQNRVFLTGKADAVTTAAAVWDEILASIKDAYPLWLKKHDELVAKINSQTDKDQREILSKEELLFAKTFSRVKLYHYMMGAEQ